MKKIKFFMILMPLIIIISGCTVDEKKEENKDLKQATSSPLLYEVTKEGSDIKLYLFGSIHAAKKELYPLPDYVLDSYKKSDAIAVEFDLIEYNQDLEKQLKLVEKFVNPDGKKIEEYLGKDTYDKAVEILKRNKIYNSLYDVYSPVMWFSLLENALIGDAKLYSTYGVDENILEMAKSDNKEIIELESADYQMNILFDVDIKVMSAYIKMIVDSYDESVETMESLYDGYEKGDNEKLIQLLNEDQEIPDNIRKEYSKDIIKGLEKFNKALGNSRNIIMAEKLDNYFKDGKNIFCTVGLAHVIGDTSIIELLENKGYTIKQIS